MCADEVVAKQLVQLFCERMGTARHLTLAVFYAGDSAQVGLGASSRVAFRFWRAARERISVAGYSIFKVQGCLLASARWGKLCEDTVHHDQIVAHQGRFQSLEQVFLLG